MRGNGRWICTGINNLVVVKDKVGPTWLTYQLLVGCDWIMREIMCRICEFVCNVCNNLDIIVVTCFVTADTRL